MSLAQRSVLVSQPTRCFINIRNTLDLLISFFLHNHFTTIIYFSIFHLSKSSVGGVFIFLNYIFKLLSVPPFKKRQTCPHTYRLSLEEYFSALSKAPGSETGRDCYRGNNTTYKPCCSVTICGSERRLKSSFPS